MASTPLMGKAGPTLLLVLTERMVKKSSLRTMSLPGISDSREEMTETAACTSFT
eukprot:CAMPEP_0170540756 /NCGR_PEP_ID=MMETSP0211-20121228/703_1 /TAXON_ID=311385 /ORGANISM="Pseudokeronopsis sp., Strain OXSARD2" /LENGTH=53 /DNA_ID=CAMNT_0010843279 /DNA_START=348 /DNA_END=509 /DNA_ORIENTATION=+